MKKFILLLFFTSLTSISFSQKEGNIWAFMIETGLDFNYTPPRIIDSTIQLIYRKFGNWPQGPYTPYHCLSDSNGAILTYVGYDISFNKKHKEMPNSWAGSLASTNTSAAVFRWPYNDTLVYIFRTQNTYSYDLQYSLVNLKLDSGRGDVMKGYKYAELSWDKFRPGFAFFQQPNKRDMWMVVKRIDTPKYYSFKISSKGIDSANPVISEVSLHAVPNPGYPYDALSTMKVSPDGKTFLQYSYDVNKPSLMELVHFSDSTGKVSDPILIPAEEYANYEFSKSGRFLFGRSSCYIYQYDLSVWDSAAIMNSKKLVAYESAGFNGLQLGPDCRIYTTHDYTGNNRYISVINNPEDTGIACNYIDTFINITPHYVNDGFPNIYPYQYRFDLRTNSLVSDKKEFCLGDTSKFCLKVCSTGDYIWNFGDASKLDTTYNNDTSQWHIYQDTGTYQVKVYIHNACGRDTQTINIHIQQPPQITIGSGDTSLCSGNQMKYTALPSGLNYQWSNGDTTQISSRNQTDTLVYCMANNGVCYVKSDTQKVYFITQPQLNLGSDTGICMGEKITFSAGINNQIYNKQWSTSDTSNEIELNTQALVWLKVNNKFCEVVDSVNLTIFPLPTPKINKFNSNSYIVLGYPKHQWYNGNSILTNETDSIYTPTSAGFYKDWVTDKNGCSAFSDSVTVNLSVVGLLETLLGFNIKPNPANNQIEISYSLPTKTAITINLQNSVGMHIANIVNYKTEEAGNYKFTYNFELAKGIYLIRLQTQIGTQTLKLIVGTP